MLINASSSQIRILKDIPCRLSRQIILLCMTFTSKKSLQTPDVLVTSRNVFVFKQLSRKHTNSSSAAATTQTSTKSPLHARSHRNCSCRRIRAVTLRRRTSPTSRPSCYLRHSERWVPLNRVSSRLNSPRLWALEMSHCSVKWSALDCILGAALVANIPCRHWWAWNFCIVNAGALFWPSNSSKLH